MKKMMVMALAVILVIGSACAQDKPDQRDRKEDEGDAKEAGGFRKENLFTGGSVSFSIGNQTFLIGGTPVFGYSVADWLDAGLAINYTYTSYRDITYSGDKLHQTVFGGGPFVKLYPVRFLFVQGQFEHNTINEKYYPGGGSLASKASRDANSLLLGAGYASNRDPDFKQTFFYISILFDVMDSRNSPYADPYNRILPIIKGGIQVPLFQGHNKFR